MLFRRSSGLMHWSSAVQICCFLFLATVLTATEEVKEYVLVDNKCKCATVTSKLIPSKDNPEEEVLERNIRITVPLLSRQNISDPTSPIRTKFVYRLSELCKKCDPTEVELENQVVTSAQSSGCDGKCYTTTFPFLYRGVTHTVKAALTPASCYAD
uniref:Joining chain of multimeric IgA and IgM n=1 Tax=Sphenodon punctatus TaxID=8508 RepID=A0A8D0GJT5_SPHPU